MDAEETKPPDSGSEASPNAEEAEPSAAAEDLERRVRTVWHLDPFRVNLRPDGRFSCQLKRSPEELTPQEAAAVLRQLEPVLERLKKRAAAG